MIIKKAFHGTPFTFSKFTSKNKGVNTNHSKQDVGFHFSQKRGYAIIYSKLHDRENAELYKLFFNQYPKCFRKFEPQLIEVSLVMYKPLKINISKKIDRRLISYAITNGYDGIIAENKNATAIGKEYVVFSPKQIQILKKEKLFKMASVKAKQKQLNS